MSPSLTQFCQQHNMCPRITEDMLKAVVRNLIADKMVDHFINADHDDQIEILRTYVASHVANVRKITEQYVIDDNFKDRFNTLCLAILKA